jgi:hypothetical protein
MMVNRTLSLGCLIAGLCLAQQATPEAAPATFRSQSDLVMAPFHVNQGKRVLSDLKLADIVLLEDGKERPFTVFEGPGGQTRPPRKSPAMN